MFHMLHKWNLYDAFTVSLSAVAIPLPNVTDFYYLFNYYSFIFYIVACNNSLKHIFLPNTWKFIGVSLIFRILTGRVIIQWLWLTSGVPHSTQRRVPCWVSEVSSGPSISALPLWERWDRRAPSWATGAV